MALYARGTDVSEVDDRLVRPFPEKEKVWTWKQIGNAKVEAMADVLRTAAFVYGDRSYSELVDNLKPIHEHIQ